MLYGEKMPNRTEGWENRLREFLQIAATLPFERGSHCCATFAGRCVEIMQEREVLPEFRGDYKTKEDAYKFLKEKGYTGLSSIADKILGKPLENVRFAKRGDVVLVVQEGQEALGIVDLTGRNVLTVGLQGLVSYPLSQIVAAWEV